MRGAVKQGAWFLDFNSASPGAKQRAAGMIDAAGGRYVEGAVMTSVPPYRIKVPLLLGGGDAAALAPKLVELGFVAKVASDKLGVASAVKMCRSVMIKGLEAMVIESFTTARAYGVEDAVLASLKETFPGIDWEKQGAYFFQRVIEHGRRRSEEVREVAETVREAGPDTMVGAGHRRAPGLGRRSRRRRPVRPTRHQGICTQCGLAHRGGPDSRGDQVEKQKRVGMIAPARRHQAVDGRNLTGS